MSALMQVVMICLSAAATLISSLVLFYLKSLNIKIEKIDSRVDRVEDRQDRIGRQKSECQRDFVDKVDYIREVTANRNATEKLMALVSELNGKMTVVEQMPQVCASVAGQIVKEMKGFMNYDEPSKN